MMWWGCVNGVRYDRAQALRERLRREIRGLLEQAARRNRKPAPDHPWRSAFKPSAAEWVVA